MALFRLIASLGLNTSQYEAGLKRAQSLSVRWGANIAYAAKGWLAAAFGTAAITAATRKAVDYASKIQDVSDTLGVSTTRVQQWAYAAAQTGASLDDFTKAFNKLQRDNPNLTLEETLKLFDDISKTIRSGALGPSGNAALAFERFGRSGLKMLPALSQGMSELSQQAERLGLIMGPEQVAAVDRFADAIGALSQALTSKLAVALANVAETMGAFVNGMAGVVGLLKVGGFDHPLDLVSAFKGGIVKGALEQMSQQSARAAASNLITPEAMAAKAAEKPSFSMLMPDVTENQRVGAFNPGNPIIVESKKQTEKLTQIEQNTRQVAEITRGD